MAVFPVHQQIVTIQVNHEPSIPLLRGDKEVCFLCLNEKPLTYDRFVRELKSYKNNQLKARPT